jgi:phosphatidylserine/phosphatidylglycerophosphate/cardiolipin synthase-like enzyme
MHTKLFRFRNSDKQISKYILGSANASHAAFVSNEELMIGLSSSKQLQKYCENLWSASTPLSDFEKNKDNISYYSVESFFQNGHLFVKYTRSLTLRKLCITPQKLCSQNHHLL